MGLGPYPEIGPAEAREKALEARKLVRASRPYRWTKSRSLRAYLRQACQ
jgi:hypothetical protein